MIGKLIVNALAFYIVGYLIPGFTVDGWQSLLVASIVWGVLALFIKPIVTLFTLPLTFLTLGLFSFVINAALLLLTARLVDGLSIDGFVTALVAAVALAIVNAFLGTLSKAA
jgi:putative membrane protein